MDFVDGGEPPVLLLQGSGDRTIAPRNAASLTAAIRGHGQSVEVRIYPRVGHSGILMLLSLPLRGHESAIADSVQFIVRTHPRAEFVPPGAASALCAWFRARRRVHGKNYNRPEKLTQGTSRAGALVRRFHALATGADRALHGA